MSKPSRVRHLARDRRGFVMLWFAMSLPVTIGMAGVMIDSTRLSALHTELQSIADAAALAGARDLDGSDDSISKATAAAKALLNKPLGATSTSGDQILDPEFGSMDQDAHKCNLFAAGAGGYSVAQNQLADCIRVTTQNRSMSIYLAQLVKLGTTATAQARATAESRTIACDVTPLRMCLKNPSYMDSVKPGVQFILKALGKAGSNGDFGIVDPPNGVSTAEGLAMERPNFCFTEQNTVTPGGKASATAEGLNVRFDIYDKDTGKTGNPLKKYKPAPNVTKGWKGADCNNVKAADFLDGYALPRDAEASFTNGPFDAAILGDGTSWKAQLPTYINNQHGLQDAAFQVKLQAAATRFDIYKMELGITDESTLVSAPPASTMPQSPSGGKPEYNRGIPICVPGGNDPTRRILYVAVVDCAGNHGNSTPPRRSTRYVKFFMTEPVTFASETSKVVGGGAVLAEFIKTLKPNDNDGKLHYMVQLVN